jgi:hypothetical protein
MGDISREADEQFAGERYDRDASSDGRATRHRNVDVVFRFAHDSPLEEGVYCELVSESEISEVSIPVRFWAILVS